jgi:hypothetical protein
VSKIFDLVPSWVYAAAIAVLMTACGANYVLWQREKAAFASFKAEVAEAAQRAQEAALKRERQFNNQIQKAQNESRKREVNLRADADAARSERDGLRNDIDAGGRDLPGASRAACIERANTLGELLEQCATALEGVAGKADRHANDARLLLDGWPK